MTMTPGNYLEHAVEWFQQSVPFTGAKHQPLIDLWRGVYADALKAPRFLLPEGGVAVTTKLTHLVTPVRLPYPCIVLEFTMGAHRLILIAREMTDNNGKPHIAVYHVYVAKPPIGREHEGLYWVPNEVVTVIDLAHFDRKLDGSHAIRLINMQTGQRVSIGSGADHVVKCLQENCGLSVLSLIQALQCCNVTTGAIPPSAALNKKRIANNRLPFVEYKVLMLGDERSASTPQGGHHASPRQHLRRGHIRRISDNRTVWVNQCLVGNPNKGFIVKDYRVKA